MGTLNLRLPESLYQQVSQLTLQEGTSVNRFIVAAVAEKVAAMTGTHPEQRAANGDHERFQQALAKVNAAPPDERDRV